MAKKRKPAKSIVSVSITLEATQMLNALADTYVNGNRSKMMETIIRSQAAIKMGLTPILKHTKPNWVEGDPPCNPKSLKGLCQICYEVSV